MMDAASRILNLFLNPYPWVCLFLLVSLAARSKGKGQGPRVWGILLVILLWLAGTRYISEKAMFLLERGVAAPSAEEMGAKGIRTVVVLTGGGYPQRGGQFSTMLPPASLARFTAGFELAARLGPDCRLIFSGSAGRTGRDLEVAEGMKLLALRLNPKVYVEAESRSGSTAEHPVNLKPLVGDKPFALVTSAYHLPRSLRSFRRQGLDPVAYPADSQVQGRYRWTDWLPGGDGYARTALALREHAALAVYTLRGW